MLKNLVRDDRKGGRFIERRTGPYIIAEVCGKNLYILSNQNGLLKKKANSSNLTRYFEQTNDTRDLQVDPVPKRKSAVLTDKEDEEEIEVAYSTPFDTLTFTPVCEDWQKFHSSQLKLEYVCSNGINHGLGTRTIGISQPLKTSPIESDGNCLFRAFSHILTGSQESHGEVRAIIISFILKNASLFKSVCPDIAKHIHTSKMDEIGTWGTEIEIFAMATILNTAIYVYSKFGSCKKWLKYEPLTNNLKDYSGCNEVIMLMNLSHHFEPATTC